MSALVFESTKHVSVTLFLVLFIYLFIYFFWGGGGGGAFSLSVRINWVLLYTLFPYVFERNTISLQVGM